MLVPDLTERDRRMERIRAAMHTAGLDALIVAGKGHWWTGRGYLRYFTDFHLWGHDGLLLIPLEGEPALTLSSAAVAERIARRGWVSDTRGDVYLTPRLIDAVKEKRLEKGRIGLAGKRFILSAGSYEALLQGLPDATFSDADDLIDHVRAVRSEFEIRQIYDLWKVAKPAMERFAALVTPGANQLELCTEITRDVYAKGARDILVFVGEAPEDVNPPRDVALRCDDKLRFHLEICGPSGHWCEITVNCAFREPSDLEVKLMESELRAFEAIRAAAKPGLRLSDLAALFEEQLREDGWELGEATTHFDFHGQGLDTIERPWFSAQAPWGQSQDWPLEAGMTFSYHPRRRVAPAPRWSTGINEDILITETGAQRFSIDWEHRWRPMA